MPLPEPVPGRVIRYNFLWSDEARAGALEGKKDRPVVIVLAKKQENDDKLVFVTPITHSTPDDPERALPLPRKTALRLGLDEEPAWIIIGELNKFIWSGPDIRPLPDAKDVWTYGDIPQQLFVDIQMAITRCQTHKKLRTSTPE
ncbi:hypothetical protein [Thalassospira lucentensis]|uniref:hypothetical protein n=1 Tax=Thalassospira lucentensis TaxID=168935 RepID=UPI0029430BEB|nr:hypothetical protein [Thalassospira lucentensis]WOI08940.1 hypothetical protein R1T41_00495 [Thalassospira lucentensis]